MSLPDGLARLHVMILGNGGSVLGHGPVTGPLELAWHDGRLHVAYGPVQVPVTVTGTVSHGALLAKSAVTAGPLHALTLFTISPAGTALRAGDSLTLLGGMLALTFPEKIAIAARPLTMTELMAP